VLGQRYRIETDAAVEDMAQESARDLSGRGYHIETDATVKEMAQESEQVTPLKRVARLQDEPWANLWAILTNGSVVLSPLRSVTDPAAELFRTDHTWSDIAYAWTRLLWALCIWSIFGGAIARVAARQFACDERVTLTQALRFAVPKFLSYISAPLMPVAGLGFFWLLCVLGGLVLGWIPVVGDPIIGVLWFLPLIAAFLMALMLVGVAVGWPLMIAAISTEGSDGFDGLSRAYSYVYNRPWYYLFLAALAIVYGAAVIFVIWLFASLIVYLAGWSVASGLGLERTAELLSANPELLGGSQLLTSPEGAASSVATVAAGTWTRVISLVTVGFVYSYFWTAMTVIYFLLRKSDDDTDLNEVFLPREEKNEELSADAMPSESATTSVDEQPAATEASAAESEQAAEETGEASQQEPASEGPPSNDQDEKENDTESAS